MSEDRNKTVVGCLMLVVGYLAGHLVGMCFIAPSERAAERQRAIEAGVGRWSVNEATGETEFVYGGEK